MVSVTENFSPSGTQSEKALDSAHATTWSAPSILMPISKARERGLYRQARSLLRRASIEFTSADVDRDGTVTFNEFTAMMRSRLDVPPSEATLREWFSSIDTGGDEGDGSVSIDEFFRFTLLDVARKVGGLQIIFQPYDRDGSGRLSIDEFAAAMDDLGFDAASEAIIGEADPSRLGVVRYDELIDLLRTERTSRASAREMMRALGESLAREPVSDALWEASLLVATEG
jgi:Ca2+-binding EF-hand superfamily protein